MKTLVGIVFIMLGAFSHAQTWQSISRTSSYQTRPINQFMINPYTNDLWFVGVDALWNNQLAVIESDGDVEVFPQDFSTGFLWGADLCMAFTPEHVYYAHDNYGLYSFDGYIPQIEYGFSDYMGRLSTKVDTVFILRVYDGMNYRLVVFEESQTEITNRTIYNQVSKNEFDYCEKSSNTAIGYYPDESSSFVYLSTVDPDYLGGQYNEMKFSRLTDTLFVGGKTGISLAYAYDFFDSITPNNTNNMPSPNVLEMEWDLEDNLWAVFGTAGDTAFAIAMLEDDTWVNYFDAGSTPINFDEFLGLEIDTLGNLWVADYDHVHTLLTPNSPEWLSTLELQSESSFTVFPNPSRGTFSIRTSEGLHPTTIELMDLSGRTVATYQYQPTIHTNLPTGSYFLQLKNGNAVLGVEKVMVE